MAAGTALRAWPITKGLQSSVENGARDRDFPEPGGKKKKEQDEGKGGGSRQRPQGSKESTDIDMEQL